MDDLLTEGRNPASTNLDELTPIQLVRLMGTEDRRLISAVGSQAVEIALAITVIAERLAAGGRLIYAGAGTSGRLGVLDATECPPTFSSPPGQVVGVIAGGAPALTQAVEGAEDRPELAEADLERLQLGSRDVVVGIATSGRTPYVLGAIQFARRMGAFTIGLSCNRNSEVASLADLAITPVVGPEVLSGSTRLKAGTATKMILNMLSTGAMVRLGKTYGNLMVDLRASNTKLRARANRIVRTLTQVTATEADQLLAQCGGELKVALVVHLSRVTPDEARVRLERAQGRVRLAVQGDVAPRVSVITGRATNEVLFLGIDGGGSNTVALLSNRDRILGRGEAGPANMKAVGVDDAFRALEASIRAAFMAAGLERTQVAAACLGLAGVDRPDDVALVSDWAQRVGLAREVIITNDASLLLTAGTPDGWGLALVSGTGSIALGRTRDGRTARAGGWGYLLGDEGSGYALVMAALQAVARATDERGPRTALTSRFLDRLGLKAPQELIRTVYGNLWDRPSLASLAPLVVTTAEEGDATAQRLVRESARELALAAASVAQQLNWEGSSIPVAIAGGLLVGSERFREAVLDQIKTIGITPNPATVVYEPAQGGIIKARGKVIAVDA